MSHCEWNQRQTARNVRLVVLGFHWRQEELAVILPVEGGQDIDPVQSLSESVSVCELLSVSEKSIEVLLTVDSRMWIFDENVSVVEEIWLG